jgi:LacI family transcriptional regulator
MIDGFEKECRESGYEMVMCYLDRRNLDYEELVKWLINDTTSAIVLLGSELIGDDLEIFKGAKCPFLTLDYWSSDMIFGGVTINNADSARMATQYLINKGHRNIGYLRGEFRISAFRSRAVGYKIAMNKRGLEIDSKNVFTLETTMDGSYKDMLKILNKKPKLPTALQIMT